MRTLPVTGHIICTVGIKLNPIIVFLALVIHTTLDNNKQLRFAFVETLVGLHLNENTNS